MYLPLIKLICISLRSPPDVSNFQGRMLLTFKIIANKYVLVNLNNSECTWVTENPIYMFTHLDLGRNIHIKSSFH